MSTATSNQKERLTEGDLRRLASLLGQFHAYYLPKFTPEQELKVGWMERQVRLALREREKELKK